MRQAGILAAACLYALDHHRERLADDHRRARELRAALAALPGALDRSRGSVETNILVIGITVATPERWCEAMARRGVRIVPFGTRALRAVLHLDVDDQAVRFSAEAFAACARELREG